METKFTPGPWTVDGPPHNQIVWSGPEDRVCFLAHSDGRDEERDIATGKLIAAAPDLYKFASQALMPMHDAAIFLAESDDASYANAAGALWAAYEALKDALAKASDGGA